MAACLLGAWLPVSIQPTLQRRASKCQDDDDGDDEDTNSDDDDDDDEEDNDDDDDDDGNRLFEELPKCKCEE